MSIDPLQIIAAMREHRESLHACDMYEGEPFSPYEAQPGPEDEQPVQYTVRHKDNGHKFGMGTFTDLNEARRESLRQNHIHNMGVIAGYEMALAELEAKLKHDLAVAR